jgi:hypothetical protein
MAQRTAAAGGDVRQGTKLDAAARLFGAVRGSSKKDREALALGLRLLEQAKAEIDRCPCKTATIDEAFEIARQKIARGAHVVGVTPHGVELDKVVAGRVLHDAVCTDVFAGVPDVVAPLVRVLGLSEPRSLLTEASFRRAFGHLATEEEIADLFSGAVDSISMGANGVGGNHVTAELVRPEAA